MKKRSDMIRIPGTGFGLKAYSAEYQAPQMHEDILEIIYCLKGSVKFFYSYEEFTLQAGEFISVDKDAFYLYDGKDNICISFYFNLKQFSKKYPHIRDSLFICEGTKDSQSGYPSEKYEKLKGALLSLLYYIVLHEEDYAPSVCGKIQSAADAIIGLMLDRFDVLFYYKPETLFNEAHMNQYRNLQSYLNQHKFEKLSLHRLAQEFHLTEKYISEFFSKNSLTYQETLAYLRANASEKYLLSTDLSIMEISEICGFSDVKYYYKAFHKWYRCTPREFRVRYKEAKRQEQMNYDIDLQSLKEEIEHQILDHYMQTYLK